MSKKRRSERKKERPGILARLFPPDARLLLIVGLPVSIIAAFALNNNPNRSFSWQVFYVWYLGIILAYLMQLALLGRFVLPPTATHTKADEGENVRKGEPAFREGMFLLFFQAFIVWLPAGIRRLIRYPECDIPPYIPDCFRHYRAGILPSHYAAVIGRFSEMTRVAGPGYVRAGNDEKFLSFIDLSLQIRNEDVKVTTQDGIPLETSATAIFLAKPPAERPDQTIPFPYSKKVLFLLHSANGRDVNGKPIHWSDRLSPSVGATLANEVAKYRLDELYRPRGSAFGGEESTPIESIREQLAKNLDKQLKETFEFDHDEDNPISLFRANYGGIQPPEEIVDQRVASVNAEWQQIQARNKMAAEREEIVTRRVARINANVDMIQGISTLLSEFEDISEDELTDVILLRTVEALDQLIEGRRRDEPDEPLPDANLINMATYLAEYLTSLQS